MKQLELSDQLAGRGINGSRRHSMYPQPGDQAGQSGESSWTDLPETGDVKITAKSLYKLLEKQKFRCALTGDELTPDNSSLDHIMPLSSGGEHVFGNLQFVTKEANAMKGTLSQEDLIRMCSKVVAKQHE